MFDATTIPGIDNVDHLVGTLNNRRVPILAHFFLECEHSTPTFVVQDSHLEWSAFCSTVVVDE